MFATKSIISGLVQSSAAVDPAERSTAITHSTSIGYFQVGDGSRIRIFSTCCRSTMNFLLGTTGGGSSSSSTLLPLASSHWWLLPPLPAMTLATSIGGHRHLDSTETVPGINLSGTNEPGIEMESTESTRYAGDFCFALGVLLAAHRHALREASGILLGVGGNFKVRHDGGGWGLVAQDG